MRPLKEECREEVYNTIMKNTWLLFSNLFQQNPMNLKALTPNLVVEDVNKSSSYYQTTLGFETIMTVPIMEEIIWDNASPFKSLIPFSIATLLFPKHVKRDANEAMIIPFL